VPHRRRGAGLVPGRHGRGAGIPPRGAPEGALLTPKEREVLVLVLRRCSNAEIAETLYLSLPTVKTHLRNILRKLGAKNHRELFQTRAREASDL
jgi:DNA-binding CsgD family transcriptional regulator